MRFRLSLVFLGLAFFASPNFNLLDITPDFIGVLLIMAGISKIYVNDENIKDARKSAKFLFWISVLRLVLCVFANSGHNDYLMPFAFIVCVLEAIFMISMFKDLYLGLEYTLMRADCEKLVKGTSEAFTMAFIFTVASKLLEFFPYICDIVRVDAELSLDSNVSGLVAFAQMKNYFLAAALLLGAILGLIYIAVTAKAWFPIIKSKEYSAFLCEKYKNYLITEREKHLAGIIGKTYFLLTASVFFMFDFYIDGVNFIPTCISVILVLAAILTLSRTAETKKLPAILIGFSAICISCLSYIFMTRVLFGTNYLYANESFNSDEFVLLESGKSVAVSALISIIELILIAVLVFMCLSQMKKVFEREKRKVALPMLRISYIQIVLALAAGAFRKIMSTLEAHLATNPEVGRFIRNKATITIETVYNEYMQNPLIVDYERVSSLAYYSGFAAIILVLISALYLLRIRRFTDGDTKVNE